MSGAMSGAASTAPSTDANGNSSSRETPREKLKRLIKEGPERYEWAIINLKQGGFLDDPETSRVVIEKPFGYDLQSANHLQSVVGRHLREKQVYRIDHYLGKDTVNNILATRFGNILLEPLWNREYIEEVQIYATERITNWDYPA